MHGQLSRRQFLTVGTVAVAAVAGCTGGDDARTDAETAAAEQTDATDEGNTDEEGDLPLREPVVPLDHDLSSFEESAVSGGVSKDGIPSIDNPSFAGPEWGDDQMDPGDPVFGVELEGEARAYPQHILVRHEIVNDEFGDRGVAVTYCPLTGTVIGYERGTVEFGVSGNLVNSNLIMYDRETDSWWPQMLGTSILGPLKGRALREVPVTWTTWERWRKTHADTAVLTDETDRAFDYRSDPYGEYNPAVGYYSRHGTLFDTMAKDESYHPKEVFISARNEDGAVTFHKNQLREKRLLEATVGGVPYLAVYDHALDSAAVYRNPDGMTFTAESQQYTGQNGEQFEGDELPLEQVNAFDAMWFAWAGFYPSTEVVGP